VRLLERLGHDVARRHLHVLAVDPGERHLDHAAQRRLEALQPCLALAGGVDLEAGQLGLARGLAAAEVDPPAGQQIERGDAFGDTGGMVERRRGQDHSVAEADARRALAARGQEDLRRRRVAVLLEEVVLDLPHVLEAQGVGERDLLERVLKQPVLRAVRPRSAHLVLVEDAELHGPM
jgi:hypothetical protein